MHHWKDLDTDLRRLIEARLEPSEDVLDWFAPDLNAVLHFAQTFVVLTDRRLLVSPTRSAQPSDAEPESTAWLELAHTRIAELRTSDRAGLGTLEIVETSGATHVLRYTISHVPAVDGLTRRFRDLRESTGAEEPRDEEDELDAEAAAHPARTKSLLRLTRFARPSLGLIILGFALTLTATALSLVPPALSIPIIDDILIPYQNQWETIEHDTQNDPLLRGKQLMELKGGETERMTRLTWYLLGMGAAAVGAWVLAWLQGAVMAVVSERISANLRNQTYEHLLRMSLEYFGGKRTGDLIARISSDTDRICTFLSDTAVDFGADVLMFIGTAAILVSINLKLALATLCPLPVIAWLTYFLRRRLQEGFARGGRTWSEMTSVLADSIPGIRVVKAFAQEGRESERFRAANRRVVDANTRVNTLWTFFWPTVALFNQLGLLVVWAFGAWLAFEFQIRVGVLTAFLVYISRFYGRLESMSRMFSATQRAAASAHRVLEILDQQPKVADPAHPVAPGRIEGRIQFLDVTFRYGSRAVLNSVDLDIHPGEMIGLVGPSGAGKTTLINLVCRFYDVSDGAILVDGTDIRQFALADHRRNIGVVLQEPFLFFGTVAENISYGRPNATPAEIMAAARAARAHEFILRLPDGYDSMVGERGQTLSGGERQRISIARALLIDPRILILDEATSSVDTETEREIQLALENLVRGRTTIAIAHRLSTLRRADRLVVMERGRIVEVGRHEELLRRSGVYARLYHAQFELEHGGTAQRAASAQPSTTP